MKPVSQVLKLKLSLKFVLPVVAMALAGASFCEVSALHRIEPKPPKKLSCIRCHTSKETLSRIADKTGDPLYLVHTGDLTKVQLKDLQTHDSEPDDIHFKLPSELEK